jgi:hypothetical protein
MTISTSPETGPRSTGVPGIPLPLPVDAAVLGGAGAGGAVVVVEFGGDVVVVGARVVVVVGAAEEVEVVDAPSATPQATRPTDITRTRAVFIPVRRSRRHGQVTSRLARKIRLSRHLR